MKFDRYSHLTSLFFTILCLSACSLSHKQRSSSSDNQPCISEQLLSINREENPTLFEHKKDTIDIFTEIRDLALAGEIYLWENRSGSMFFSSIIPSRLHDSINDNNVDIYYNPYFDLMATGYAPYKNQKGEDSLQKMKDGTYVFIYPPLSYEPIDISKVTELRIKEIRSKNTEDDTNSFEPTFVGFDVYTAIHKVHFWVKLKDLEQKIKINKEWVKNIQNRNYKGFSYFRTQCSDPECKFRSVQQ